MRGAGVAIATYAGLLLGAMAVSAREFTPLVVGLLCVAAIGLAGGAALIILGARWVLPAAAFVGLFLALGLFLFGRRIAYIVQYGGMDGGPESGSPMAFLIGWVFEQVAITVPSAGLALWLRGALRAARNSRAA